MLIPFVWRSANEYYNINFDCEGESISNIVNTANKPVGIGCTDNSSGSLTEIVTDDIKGNKVYKIYNATVPNAAFRLGNEAISTSDEKKVLYYELSFFFSERFLDLRIDDNETILRILPDSGEAYVGGLGIPALMGSKVTNFQFKKNKWYNIMIAEDFTNLYSGEYARIYMWANGTPLVSASTGITQSTAVMKNDNPFSKFRITIYPGAIVDNASTMLDDIKAYTKDETIQADWVDLIDPNNYYTDCEITSDSLKIENNTIYVPNSETLGGVSELIAANGGIGFADNNGAVTEEAALTKQAVGCKIFARAENGIGLKEYEVKQGLRLYDVDLDTVSWMRKNETITNFTPITDKSTVEKDDDVKVKFTLKNDTLESKNSIVVMAMYSEGALKDYKFCSITSPVGESQFESEPMKVTEENFDIKIFIWNSMEEKTPQMTRIELS